jgi:UDP-N-acetylglucosamine diphosphorylase / glucose-1-phosphate thymidylyltransferase / UDP-N-acetylgalactosamine diphosphorylase / glucosamine-1-phosphate N-acetyltransferase / galactosamine-1-phosphate N-acetyltransferase
MLTAPCLFDYHAFAHAALFSPDEPVWSALARLRSYMESYHYPLRLPAELTTGVPVPASVVIHQGCVLPTAGLAIDWGDTTKGGLLIRRGDIILEGTVVIMAGAILVGELIEIGAGSLVEGGATIKAPTIIGARTEVRHGAYLRGQCLIGDRCVVGHATEVKHSIFLDDAKAGHFAYLGDSILGNDTNLGAGTKCANLKFLPGTIQLVMDNELVDTGLRKLGAILGDRTQTGCNSVTNPGTIIGRQSVLMPNTTAPSGFHPAGQRIRTGLRSVVAHNVNLTKE